MARTAISDHAGIDYGCVVACVPKPRYPYPKPTPATQHLLDRGLGFEETPQTSAGFTPDAFNATWDAVAAAIARGRRRV